MPDALDRLRGGLIGRWPDLPSAVARGSLVAVFASLGVMQFFSGADRMTALLEDHVLLPSSAGAAGPMLAIAVGVVEITIAILLVVGPRLGPWFRYAALSAVFVAAAPLTLLATNSVWIDDLGGFPAIGSGQGLIKYLTVVGLARFVHALATDDARGVRHARIMMLTGLMLPLVWIGGMKFTEIEAQGIEPLLSTSPFFAWMLNAFTLQTASIVIGIGELVTAGLLAAWWFNRPLFRVGAVLTTGTFLTTLSFLLSTPGAFEPSLGGFPALSVVPGQFLIKDIVLLGAAIWLFGEARKNA